VKIANWTALWAFKIIFETSTSPISCCSPTNSIVEIILEGHGIRVLRNGDRGHYMWHRSRDVTGFLSTTIAPYFKLGQLISLAHEPKRQRQRWHQCRWGSREVARFLHANGLLLWLKDSFPTSELRWFRETVAQWSWSHHAAQDLLTTTGLSSKGCACQYRCCCYCDWGIFYYWVAEVASYLKSELDCFDLALLRPDLHQCSMHQHCRRCKFDRNRYHRHNRHHHRRHRSQFYHFDSIHQQ